MHLSLNGINWCRDQDTDRFLLRKAHLFYDVIHKVTNCLLRLVQLGVGVGIFFNTILIQIIKFIVYINGDSIKNLHDFH